MGQSSKLRVINELLIWISLSISGENAMLNVAICPLMDPQTEIAVSNMKVKVQWLQICLKLQVIKVNDFQTDISHNFCWSFF